MTTKCIEMQKIKIINFTLDRLPGWSNPSMPLKELICLVKRIENNVGKRENART